MIFKFFDKQKPLNKDSDLLNVACLMIHAARIDENYTVKEREIIKKTLTKLDDNEDMNKLMLEAEKKEADSNHIQDFTKNIKAMDKKNKIEVIQSDCLLVAKGKVDKEFFTNIKDYEEHNYDYSGIDHANGLSINED